MLPEQLTKIESNSKGFDPENLTKLTTPGLNEKVYTIDDAIKHLEENFEHYSSDVQKLKTCFRGEMLRILRFHKPTELDRVKQGFDPENLTFDGVKIQEGDMIKLKSYENAPMFRVHQVTKTLFAIYFDGSKLCPVDIKSLNITAHHPKQDPELERLENNLGLARKELEEYKSKNK